MVCHLLKLTEPKIDRGFLFYNKDGAVTLISFFVICNVLAVYNSNFKIVIVVFVAYFQQFNKAASPKQTFRLIITSMTFICTSPTYFKYKLCFGLFIVQFKLRRKIKNQVTKINSIK